MAKKLLKKLGKAAAVAAALYGATKLGKKKPGINIENARGANLRGKLASAMPGNLSSDMGSGDKNPFLGDPKRFEYPMNYKKGGRVTGIAKRGFGRALMKGKK